MNVREAFIARQSDELFRKMVDLFEESQRKVDEYVCHSFGEHDDTDECVYEAQDIRAEVFSRAIKMLNNEYSVI